MDYNLLHKASLGWQKFIAQFKGKVPSEMEPLKDIEESTNLHHYIAAKDFVAFDRAVSRLSVEYLYDQENIKTIYNCYLDRDLAIAAFDYITKAASYMTENKITIEPDEQVLIDNAENSRLFPQLKQGMIHIRSLQAKNIPFITPDIVNNKRRLNDFILNELVEASKVLMDKIHGIKKIPHENRFNDLLLAILRLRFEIWGWTIHDQARTGNSPSKKDAGESDILIQAGGKNVALVEALILKGSDKAYTQSHLKKMYKYVAYLETYYLVVYFKGKASRFEKAWSSYKANVLSCSLPSPFSLDVASGFICMLGDFDQVNNLKIARTGHNNNAITYHIMINLGE